MIKPDKITFKVALYIFLIVVGLLILILTVAGTKDVDAGFISVCITTWFLFTAFCLSKIMRAKHRRRSCHKGDYSLYELDEMDGIDFEHFTCDILLANGFEHAESTKASWDFGVDVLATKDNVTYAIQCKRYSSLVGIEAVQQAYAGRAYYECHVAVVFTNQYFTRSARKLADKIGVVLWDRNMLYNLL